MREDGSDGKVHLLIGWDPIGRGGWTEVKDGLGMINWVWP